MRRTKPGILLPLALVVAGGFTIFTDHPRIHDDVGFPANLILNLPDSVMMTCYVIFTMAVVVVVLRHGYQRYVAYRGPGVSESTNGYPDELRAAFDFPEPIEARSAQTLEAIHDAALMPLNDAAYALWADKAKLDLSEPLADIKAKPPAKDIPDAEGILIRRIMLATQLQRINASSGSTLGRLTAAHPEASIDDVKNAIQLAVQLETAFNRTVWNGSGGVWSEVTDRIRQMRADNPDLMFSEATFESLGHRMMIALR